MNSIPRPKTLVGIIAETFKIYIRYFLKLLVIAGIVVVIIDVIDYFLQQYFISIGFPASFISLEIRIAALIVAFPLMQGALINAVKEQYLQQTISIGGAYRIARGRWGSLIGASILFYMPIFITGVAAGLSSEEIADNLVRSILIVILFISCIYLLVNWAFVLQAVLLKGLGPKAALSSSASLVKRNWWRVFFVIFVLFIITTGISLTFSLLPIVGSTIGVILSVIFFEIARTIFYYNLRLRKEQISLSS